MKRVLLGVLWFVAFWAALTVLVFVVPALMILRGLPAGASQDQISQAAADFSLGHAGALSAARWAALLIALLLAILGTAKGKLPGTRQKPQA
ncbi:MAG TPA: hypothetical protein VGH71_04675 [Gammaproteobacteria bacterium]|jgi:hypothetical protein